ncbi:ATP-grasp domain-containing protein [Paenibacillus puerhi]|uniref:hypothetical protein n=1 Tax=Paenibacillus puerhi TaxID=2692622 RepID=UPI00135CD37E|nr:hypothetical protein [Paenibacillus puerhi]
MSIERGRVLLTGGRAPAALELARQLASAGWSVFAAESAERHLCRASRSVSGHFRLPEPIHGAEPYISALEEIVRREEIDCLIPTCEEIFYVSAGLERLSRHCRVIAAPLGQLKRLHSKWDFIQLAERLGFPVPQTLKLVPGDQASLEASLKALQQAEFAGGVVLKPEFSRFSSQVQSFDNPREAVRFMLHVSGLEKRNFEAAERGRERKAGNGNGMRASFREAQQIDAAGSDDDTSEAQGTSAAWVMQRLVRGRQLCTYGIAHEGELRAHAVYESRYTAGRGATVYFEAIVHDGLREWVERFVRAERFSGQIAFDFIEDGHGVLYPLECNPRATSGVHLFGPGDGLVQALLDNQERMDALAEPKRGARAMLALPMLAYGLPAHLSWQGMKRWLGDFRQASDVVYRSGDPGPFLEQARMLWELKRRAAASGMTIMEASTADIEWNGGTM